MSVALPSPNNYEIGMTLDSNFMRKPNPFTKESMAELSQKWDEMSVSGDVDSSGSFSMTARLSQTQEQKQESIGVEASLGVSYMAFSVCSNA